MVRRIASQVHKQASRLTRAGLLKTPPIWYEAVLEHPPLPLPPREQLSRTSYDSSSITQNQDQAPSSAPPPTPTPTAARKKKSTGLRPLPVTYTEDEIRRQFFRDHPFEAFRARSLTETGVIENEHPIRGLTWTRLNQRGRNPSPEEYVQNRRILSIHPSPAVVVTFIYPKLAQCSSP